MWNDMQHMFPAPGSRTRTWDIAVLDPVGLQGAKALFALD